MILVALLLAQTSGSLIEGARAKLSVAPPAEKDARYRVEDDDEAAVDGKARAVGTTGQQCAVIGARVCTRKPRTWIKTQLPR